MDWSVPVWIIASLSALLVLLVPGGAILSRLPAPGSRMDAFSWLADAAALSISAAALVGMWLFVPGIRLGGAGVVVIFAICLLVLLSTMLRRGISPPSGATGWLVILGGALLLAALLAWRFYQARMLVLPAWVDSVHHTLIVRKIAEYGGVPPDLTPYLPVPFYYHYGFHLITALFVYWSGLPVEQAVLWFGQVINAGVALSVYRVARVMCSSGEPALGTVTPERVSFYRAVVAAALVGFAFQMPAYYLTWGRYTLLTGLLVLGPAIAAAYEVYQNPRSRSAHIRLALLSAGLCLVHYLGVVLFVLFLGVLGLASLVRVFSQRSARMLPWQMAFYSALGAGLAAPWLWRVWSYNRQDMVRMVLPSGGEAAANTSAEYLNYIYYLLGPRHSFTLLILGAVGLVFALRRSGLRPLIVWSILLALLTLPWGLRFGPFRPDHYAIVLFFPAAILLADLLVNAAASLGWVFRPWAGRAALVLVAGIIVLWGLRETRVVLNPVTIFATAADVAALDWVEENIPEQARFFITPALWQNQVYRGTNGGFWLLPLTGRGTLVPPVIYDWGPKEYDELIGSWASRAEKITGCTPEFWQLVRDAQLTHVYLRDGQGSLRPSALDQCPRLRKVYQQDSVFIYEIIPVQ